MRHILEILVRSLFHDFLKFPMASCCEDYLRSDSMDFAVEFPMFMVGSFFLELWPFDETLFMHIISNK